jgi:hypothetical protein
MMMTSKTTLLSAAALALILIPASASAQTSLRERVVAAVQAVQSACGADINKFCGSVTPGEGRVVLCMQAHEDQLSRSCQFALYRASRNLDRALDRVERVADACWGDIESQCGNADRIGQCVMDKAQSFSPACQSVVAAVRQVGQALETRGGP